MMMTYDNPENQKNDREQCRELVSSLADGQLRGLEFARAVTMVGDGGDARATWHAYHVMGDVLRSGEMASCVDDAAFVSRLRARLQIETAGRSPILAPYESRALAANGRVTGAADENDLKNIANSAHKSTTSGINTVKAGSTSESPFRWKMLAGVASVAAVGAIGWSMVSGMREDASPLAPQLAQNLTQQQIQVQTQPQQPVMIRDPRLDALLAAHKQFGGTSALQMPAGFLRNATFESPAR
jgi:sigma-E factor negative regulatory protein RseA